MPTKHIPVLLQEILEHTHLAPGMTIFDGTLGGGGYAQAFSHITGEKGMLVGTDLDPAALKRVSDIEFISQTNFIHGSYAQILDIADDLGVKFDVAVVDLGLSSDQLDLEKRGFSFKDESQPLDMRFNSEDGETAADILNSWSEENIADVIFGFGGERYSRGIAKRVVERRLEKKIATVGDLVEIIKSSTPYSYHKRRTHPATKTFQALRIVVNTEWKHIQEFLENAPKAVRPGGYIAIVSFHSGEDKVVKHTFRDMKEKGIGTIVTKKPITAGEEELSQNPRSRSALLRIFRVGEHTEK